MVKMRVRMNDHFHVVRGFRIIDDVFAAMRHGSFLALIVGISCIDIQSVLPFGRQLNEKHDDQILFVVVMFDVLIENIRRGGARCRGLGRGCVLIGIEFSMELQYFRTFEFDHDRQVAGFEDRLKMRQRMNIEVTNGFGWTPFT